MLRLYNIALYLFLIALLFYRIPNFYFIPGVNSAFLTTQVVARGLIVLALLIKLLESFSKGRESTVIKRARATVWLIISLFLIQSLSVFSAINYYSFLLRYEDMVFGILAFLSFALFKKHYKKIALVLLLPMIFNIFYQIIMVVDKDLFTGLARNILYSKQLSLVLYNLGKERTYIETYDESFIPLLFLSDVPKFPFVNYILFLGVALFSFVSRWRTRLLLLFFTFISSFIAIKGLRIQKLIVLVLLILFVAYVVNFISTGTTGSSFLDRIVFQDKSQDIAPINFRVKQLVTSIEFGSASLFGVGLGNYYDNLSDKKASNSSLYKGDVQELTEGQPHNIFSSLIAESGYLSFIVFVLMLALFLKSDINVIRGKDEYQKAFVLSFWSLFIHSLFNPNAGSFQIFFWGMRGLLLK